MKLLWCPDTASKAYIEAVQSLSDRDLEDASLAELIAAMAGGWNAQLAVEAWARGDSPATSIALTAAVKHTRGRRVTVVPDEGSAAEYQNPRDARVLVGAAEDVMGGAEGVDFMVVDVGRGGAERVMREARAGPRGMVVVCRNAEKAKGGIVLGEGMRVVRKEYLPLGRGIEILHVGVGKSPRLGGGGGRWFKHVDRVTGEEHLFKK